jgi:hypothetical protein
LHGGGANLGDIGTDMRHFKRNLTGVKARSDRHYKRALLILGIRLHNYQDYNAHRNPSGKFDHSSDNTDKFGYDWRKNNKGKWELRKVNFANNHRLHDGISRTFDYLRSARNEVRGVKSSFVGTGGSLAGSRSAVRKALGY